MSDALLDHLTRNIGPIAAVFEEIVPGEPRLDIVHVGSSLFRRYEVIVTRGMSAVPMAVPAESNEPRFAEILAVLPKGWPVRASAFGAEADYWPIRLLKTLARLPTEGNTWLGFGHTHANGSSESSVEPYAQNTSLCATIVLPPATLGERAWKFNRPDGEDVFLWAVVPLHLSELKFKQAQGVDALLELFDKHRISDKIDAQRKPVV